MLREILVGASVSLSNIAIHAVSMTVVIWGARIAGATRTVTPASVAKARPNGHGVSPASACSLLPKNSRCVLSENNSPSP